MIGFSHFIVLFGLLFYVLLMVPVVAFGGYVFGWAFRKGWDRAGRQAVSPSPIAPTA